MEEKTIEVSSQTEEVMRRVLKKLKPPPKLTVSQWADKYRVISAKASASPGRWHTDKAPYQREIMDAIGDPHIKKVVVKSSAQIGKTDAFILNVLGYYMDYAPCPIMVMQPTIEMGQTFSKDRLAPMLQDTVVLRDKVMQNGGRRNAENTILYKSYPGGNIAIVGANSPASLASRPVKVLLADEVDRYPPSAGKEGDPLSLAEKRQTTFWDRKTVLTSTPTTAEGSRIQKEYLLSSQEEWNIPCPDCGAYQPLVWANVVFERNERGDLTGEVLYRCEHCGCLRGEYPWKKQNTRGKFIPQNPEVKDIRGFHLNTLVSSFCTWESIVRKFLAAKQALDMGDPTLMITWVNTELGEVWEQQGSTVDETMLLDRREMYAAPVPDNVLCLTAGVDVQEDRLEVEVVGWGKGKESWGIQYRKFFGDTKEDQVWQELDEYLQLLFPKADGSALPILATCVDSGYLPDKVYRFVQGKELRRVWAIKGKGGAGVPYISNPTSNNRVRVPLFKVGVDYGKMLTYQRLNVADKGPNYCHFPLNEEAGYNETYFNGLTAEKMVTRFKNGRSTTVWEVRTGHKRNEPLDLRNYATAAVEITQPPVLQMQTAAVPAARHTGRRQLSRGI